MSENDNLLERARLAIEDCRTISRELRSATSLIRRQDVLRSTTIAWISALERLRHTSQNPHVPATIQRASRAPDTKVGSTRKTADPLPHTGITAAFKTQGTWTMPELMQASADVWIDLADVEDDASIADGYRKMADDLRRLAVLLDRPAGRG